MEMPKLIRTEEWEGYDIKDLKVFFEPVGKWLEFNNWFHGKTGGITEDGKFCVYKHDFDKFCDHIGLSIG